MKAAYEDIREKINEEPRWFDTHGVPRYAKFHPDLSPNIYADEVVLLKIACQNCGHRFLVEMNWGVQDKVFDDIVSLHERIENRTIHYGDPPIGCCAVGSTMNCDDLEVVEFWKRDRDTMTLEWVRDKKYEIDLNSEPNLNNESEVDTKCQTKLI